MSTTVVEFENQDVIVVEMSGRGPIGPRGRQGEPGPAGPSEWGVIQGNISDQTDLQNALDAKANVGVSYTKAEDDALLAQKADADSVYTKTETDALLSDKADTDDVYSKTEVNTLLSGKADSDTVYTKTETDALLDAKADVGDSYTKAEEDALLAVKANSADVYTKTETDTLLADKADADDVYTKDDVDDALADKADSADVYTKTETDALLLDKAPVILSSASGSIASFADGSPAPVTALSVSIEPVQSGTGDPSPDNVRPISGHDTATVTRTGKNLLDVYTLHMFIASGSKYISSSQDYTSRGVISVKPSTVYTFSCITPDSSRDGKIYAFDSSGTRTQLSGSWIQYSTFTTPSDCVGISFYCKVNDIQTPSEAHPQLELGSSASAYEAYQGTSVTIDLDGTRYGGVLNVMTGEMRVDTTFLELDGTESGWSKWNTQCYNVFLLRNTLPETSALKGYCSHVKTNAAGNLDSSICSHANAGNGVSFKNLTTYWGLPDDEVSTWTAYLASQKAAGTPIQIVAYLITPITVQLTPSQLSTLLGTNNIWADTGDTSVEYRADTKLYIDGVASATAKVTRQMIADSAIDGKAPKSLDTGDLIIVGDELRKATTNIGNGSAITASNSTTATLADVIKALQ